MKSFNQRKEKNPMKTVNQLKTVWLPAVLAWSLLLPAQAGILNGGFESGFSGWTRADQIGSEGTFYVQTGTASPVNGFTVPAPPGGINAAMTDAFGPGSHVLYQDFAVPVGLIDAAIGFSLFINNGNGSPSFFTPATLDFATTALNQQARVDIISTSADPFSVAPADVVQNLFQTATADPLISGYTPFLIDVTSHLAGIPGPNTAPALRRNRQCAPFNFGVDNVNLSTQVPEPSVLLMAFGGLAGLAWSRRRQVESLAG